MRESIGGSWLFTIVIFFIILFTGYICLSINHTKAFNVKDDIIKIIERENGFIDIANISENHDKKILSDIVDKLKEFGYRNESSCPDSDGVHVWYGFDRDGNRDNSNKKSSFCIREIPTTSTSEHAKAVYYQVVVFYQLDLPVFNNLFRFELKGDTKLVYN